MSVARTNWPGALQAQMAAWLKTEAHELPGLLSAFACAFCMFAAYSVLRPIRDTMGITSGWATLPALFWTVFAVMLAVQPLYGWMLARFRRSRVLPMAYAGFALMIVGFWLWFRLTLDHTWIARVYFVWVSVFNLFVVSVFWSLMAEVFSRAQAARLFGVIAAGLSAGGLFGPLLAGVLAVRIGTINLLLISASLMMLSAALMQRVVRWHRQLPAQTQPLADGDDAPLAGGIWEAFVQVSRSRYLLGIVAFVLLVAAANTVLYLEQQRLVALYVPDRDSQTQLFALLDFLAQAGALLGQTLLFARFQRHLGFTRTLVCVPLLLVLGFAWLAFSPTLLVVIGVMLLRRVGEFSLIRPARDMLFTVVSPSEKYKAKSLIDTLVYRGGDAVSASGLNALAAWGSGVAATMGLAGVLIAALWSAVALWLGRRFEQRRV